jgi:hypothetical protein
MRIIALVTKPKVIRKILCHLAATGIDARDPPAAPLEAQEFLARLIIMHIPEPRLHVIRYYGAYSSVVRARRRQRARAAAIVASTQAGLAASAEPPAGPDPRILRRRWAELIRRIYEADPLVCPRCGGEMRIVAFITEARVIHKILTHLAAQGADGRSPPDSSLDQRPAA